MSEENLHGHNPTRAIEAIRARAARRAAGDHSPDGRKIAMIFDGGGMRTVCTGAGSLALEHLGYGDAFDEVYATSAGVMNAAYFLAGQTELGVTIFYDRLISSSFINPYRFWKMLDVDWVFDRLVRHEKRLDVDAILASRPKFHVAMMDAETAEGRLIDAKSSPSEMVEILKAANAIPVYYNRRIEIEGRPMMDGGLVIPFPLVQAIASGCTDIIVFLTRAASYHTPDPSWHSRMIFNFFGAKGAEPVIAAYAKCGAVSRRYRELAVGANPALAPLTNGSNIVSVCLDEAETIQRITRDPDQIRTAGLKYGAAVLRMFGASEEALATWNIPERGVTP